jgi:hypothetical protein
MSTPKVTEHVPWEDFLKRLVWKQGEHVSLIGPTGGGKTTLALALLHRRKYTVILCTKPKDTTITGFMKANPGYRRMSKWTDRHSMDRQIILWPACRSPEEMRAQGQAIGLAMRDIYQRDGNWCVMADEVRYLCNNLGLKQWFDLYWLQGRSLGISVVAATQRPAWVPLEMYSQATHLFFWQDNDERNLRRIGGLGAIDPKDIMREVRGLGDHEVLYVNTRTQTLMRTRLEV